MSVVAAKFLQLRGLRIMNFVTHNLAKRNMTQKDSCCQSTPASTSTRPDPPPCPPMPNCPPAMCPPIKDPNHPCNYCPPPCIDPDAPNLTRLKRIQCKFQSNPDVPVYLKNGKIDVFFLQTTVLLSTVGFAISIYKCMDLILKP